MSKFTEFYKKVVTDEAAKKEMTAILGEKGLNKASDEELAKVSEVAKKLGVDITAEEIKSFASGNAELDEDDLEAAAGGYGFQYTDPRTGRQCIFDSDWDDLPDGWESWSRTKLIRWASTHHRT